MKDAGRYEQFICPRIPAVPQEAKVLLESLVEQQLPENEINFVGSSLGGYYATYLAEKYSGYAVLINPSVRPYETLRAYLGENKFYFEDGCWDFNVEHIEQLKNMDVSDITPDRYMVLLQTGDETLDYREAAEKFKDSRLIIEQGGDHGFVGLERYLSQIMKFSKIEP